ncbi:unnamed protein product [Allacma fusca]|uniref:Protein asunder n=1 Tax=Allacma fusca TaxID=39272 RepID=A0A8J2LSZ2_9HEXA|nr:unnamed protein product [Allacma fusca]
MGDLCHKTIFVLDHCKLMRELTGVTIEIELGNRPGANVGYFQFIPSVMKSLWNCVAESTLEYARILWDLFGDERLIRFIASHPQKAISLNDWSKAQQSMIFVQEAFAAVGPPLNTPGSIQTGIVLAIKALSEPTPFQTRYISGKGDTLSSKPRLINKGRIVCVTSCLVDFDVQEFVLSSLGKNNAAALNTDRKIPIDELEFVLLSLHPVGKEHLSRVLTSPSQEISPFAKFETVVLTPPDFHTRIQQLCVAHHDLVTTTVTGIPMKEEANASSSLNYDVTLFHPRLGPTNESQLLKWAGPTTPKGVGTNLCNTACRTTPVEVISRPTTCLSNFVLSGRSVWLEAVKKVSKANCNVLMAHGGEIWMHVMETTRNVLEDPPSISEGSGGRVTDYRIPDFVEFMKQNMLAPFPQPEISSTDKNRRNGDPPAVKPFELSKQRLWRKTIFWPITISGSILFSLSVHLETLLKLFPSDTLDELQKVECDKAFWSLMAIEARGDPPPVSSLQLKKGHKKDEQWRVVYSEIESFLRANLHSPAHESVLECFMESRHDEEKNTEKESDSKSTENKGKRSGSNGNMKSESFSPPPQKKLRLESGAEPRTNLLTLWRLKTEKKSPRILPEGLKLYAHLKESQETSAKPGKS